MIELNKKEWRTDKEWKQRSDYPQDDFKQDLLQKTYRNFEVPPGHNPLHLLPEQAHNTTPPGWNRNPANGDIETHPPYWGNRPPTSHSNVEMPPINKPGSSFPSTIGKYGSKKKGKTAHKSGKKPKKPMFYGI